MPRGSLLFAALCLVAGCGRVSREDAEDALDQAALATQAQLLMDTIVALGEGAPRTVTPESAARALAAQLDRLIDCADASAEADKVLVDFGTPDRPCEFGGRALSGCAELRILENTAERLVIDHYWVQGARTVCHEDDFSDGALTVDGTATVTWTGPPGARDIVQHDVVWRPTQSGRTVAATGTLSAAAQGDAGALRLTGSQTWATEGADWQLESVDILVAPDDFLPTEGTHVVTNPAGEPISIRYSRSEDGHTTVAVEGGGSSFSFDVFAR
jgi:hypothetical protein